MKFMMNVHSVEKSELFLFSFLWDKKDVGRWDVHEPIRFVNRLFNDYSVRHTITFTCKEKKHSIIFFFIISISLFNPYFKNVPFLSSLLNTCGKKSVVPFYLFSALLALKFPTLEDVLIYFYLFFITLTTSLP